MKKLLIVFAFFFLFWSFQACKNPREDAVNPTADVRESAYFYTKEWYLWTENLPSEKDFNAISYPDAKAVMEKVRTFSPNTPSGKKSDRWSYIVNKKEWDNRSSGINADFGCGFRFYASNDLRIRYVYSESSAGKQGVKRGWKVLSVNGVTANTANIDALNTELGKASVTIVFEKPNGSQQTSTLEGSSYKANYILAKKVIDLGAKKVAYLAFNSFLGENNGQATATELTTAFNEFKAAGATELIVDLRYNGGGYVSVQSSFANLIASQTAKGKPMFTYQYNEKYKSFNTTTNFSNDANILNLTQVIFITTSGSASASELLINNLKPYMSVKLIGSNTSGKPVGYPRLSIIMDRNDDTKNFYVFPVAFKSVNANKEGDYFDGIAVDKAVTDDLTKDFGDENEACLQTALNYFKTGQLKVAQGKQWSKRTDVDNSNQILDHDFKGMFNEMKP
jgi:carboxyl-terminal processing protease